MNLVRTMGWTWYLISSLCVVGLEGSLSWIIPSFAIVTAMPLFSTDTNNYVVPVASTFACRVRGNVSKPASESPIILSASQNSLSRCLTMSIP
jgi:hypothetical protein